MKKRILSFVMALVLAVSLLPAMTVPASAVDMSGKLYDHSNRVGPRWELTGTTLTLTGGGVGSATSTIYNSVLFFDDNHTQNVTGTVKNVVTKIIINNCIKIEGNSLVGFPNLREIEINGGPKLNVAIDYYPTFSGNSAKSGTLKIIFQGGPFRIGNDVFWKVNTALAGGGTLIPEIEFGPGFSFASNSYGGTAIYPTPGESVAYKGGTVRYTPHTHVWGYTASGATLTVKCVGNGNCPQNYKTGYNLVLSAPSSLTYNGTAKAATIGNWSAGIPSAASAKPTITYKQGGTALSGAPINAGSYTASISMKGGNNVTATASVNFTIAKKNVELGDLSVKRDNAVYDGTAKAATVTAKSPYTGLGTVSYAYKKWNAETSAWGEASATAPTNVGKYQVSVTTAAGTNFNALTTPLTVKEEFSITQAPHVHEFKYSSDGATLIATCDPADKTNFVACSLPDNKVSLTLSANDATYTGNAVTASLSSTTAWTGANLTVPTIMYAGRNTTNYTSSATAPTNAGDYTASITAGGQTASVNFSITKATETPTVQLAGWTYGETANTPAVFHNTSGGAVTYTYKVKNADDSTYTDEQPTNAGEYTVKAFIAATANYEDSTATADFTIAKADYTVTAPTKAENLVYTGSDQALLDTAGSSDGTMKYSLDGSTWETDSSAMKATNAGEYTVWYKVDGDDNHNPTSVGEIKVTIAKAASRVDVAPEANQNLVYNGTEQKLVTTGSAVGGTMEYMEYSTDGQNYTDSVPVAIDAGTYTVWYKVKGDANHNDTDPARVEVTIGKATAAGGMITETAYLRETVGESVVIELEPLPDKEATYGAVTNNNTDFFTLSGLTLAKTGHGYITAKCVKAWTKGSENAKTFTVPVTNSKNYIDYVITVSIEMVDHPVQTISFDEDEVSVTFRNAYTVAAKNDTENTNGDQFGAIKYRVLDEDGGQHVVSVNENTGELTTLKVGTAIIAAEAMGTEQYAPSEPRYITVHVAPKTLTEDMLTLTNPGPFAYDGSTSREPGYTVADGSTELTHTDYGVDITSTTSAVNAGTYTIKIDGIGNYTGSVSKTWKINKKNATMAAIEAHPNLVYTGSEHELVIAGNPIGGEVYYKVGSSGTYSMDVPKATNAGIYTVHYYVKGDNNHNDTDEASVNVTIAKATPVITTKPAASAITYGQTLASSALTGGVASTDGSFAWETSTTAPHVGDSNNTYYTVVFTPTDTANYERTDCDVQLTVNKKPVDAVIDITAPKAKETAQTELAATDDFEAATITWSPELKDGKFEYNKEYTATVTLELKDIYNTTIDGVTFTVDGAKADGVTFEDGTMTLKVVFTNTGSAPGSPSNSITAPGSAENGEVSVDKKSASAGQTVTITVTPDKGYTLETLTVTDAKGNEVALTKVDDTTYTFKMPNGKVNVDATFMEDNTMLNYFVDVPVNEYYYDAVLWAVSNGITNGTDDTHFSPNMGTTRAHVVTFLWRAAGCPEPKGDASQFTDVVAGEYYEKAVAWAIENGITKGTSATTFSPDAICTRGQIVTFLARFAGVKDEAVGYTHGFTDVNAADYFNNAVAWAKDNKITEGTTATTFSPYEDCTRAQVVTFLYRLLNK